MSVHDGHRQRMKERFLAHGLDGFAEHETLEFLLMFAIPQGNLNPLAHSLIESFGSLAGVLDASHDELVKISGVGAHTATLLALMPSLFREYSKASMREIILTTPAKSGEYILSLFVGRRVETVFLVSLDGKSRVIGTDLIHVGSVNSVDISIRKIIQTALRHSASTVLLAHNHPGGIALPSPEDCATTKTIAGSLSAVGVPLRDHIIVADNDYVSMFQSMVAPL